MEMLWPFPADGCEAPLEFATNGGHVFSHVEEGMLAGGEYFFDFRLRCLPTAHNECTVEDESGGHQRHIVCSIQLLYVLLRRMRRSCLGLVAPRAAI